MLFNVNMPCLARYKGQIDIPETDLADLKDQDGQFDVKKLTDYLNDNSSNIQPITFPSVIADDELDEADIQTALDEMNEQIEEDMER